MKKYLIIAFTALAAIVSCNKVQDIESSSEPKVLTAYNDGAATRTSLSGTAIKWTADDAISAFDLSYTNHKSTKTEISQDGAVAKFTVGTMSLTDDVYVALYPYDKNATMNASGVISTTLPEIQVATAGSFDPSANIALSDGGTNDLYFMNGGALLSVDIKNDNITKVKVTTGTWENIAGPCFVSIGADSKTLMQSTYAAEQNSVTLKGNFQKGSTYYMVVFPGEYTSTTIEFTRSDGATATYTKQSSMSLERNGNYLLFDREIPDAKWVAGTIEPTSGYVKVTSEPDSWDGEYLIVTESGSVVFDGSLTSFSTTQSNLNVTIINSTIEGTSKLDSAAVTIASMTGGYSIKTKLGYYLYRNDSTTGINGDKSTAYANSISMGSTGNVTITYKYGSTTLTLARNGNNFKYYKDASNYTKIQLYKKGTVTPRIGTTTTFSGEDAYTVTLGDSFTAPTATVTGGTGLVPTYSSSKTSVATVDATSGAVTIVGEGTTVITATYAGDNSYAPSSDEYTLTVKKAAKVYASLEALVAAGAPTTTGEEVTVSFTDAKITKLYLSSEGYRNGIYFMVGTQEVEIYCKNVPEEWVIGGLVSGTLTCPWVLYKTTWELTPDSWDDLTYKAPANVKKDATLSISGNEKALYTDSADDEFDITYNGDGALSVSSSNTSVATVTLNGTKATVHPVGAGSTSITVSAAEGTEYNAASDVMYTLTVTKSVEAAAIPFSFDGGVSAISTTQGMSHTGIGSDYASSPKLRFDDTGDKLVIKFASSAKTLKYSIKGNSYSTKSTFDVQESVDGITYTSIKTYTALSEVQKESYSLKADSRFVRFIYTNKNSGNVALGAISITNVAATPLTMSTVSCTAQTAGSLTFSWSAVANASGYKVSLDGGNTYGSTLTATSYTWTGLSASTTKTIYVKAIGDGTNYSDSEAVTAQGTTKANGGSEAFTLSKGTYSGGEIVWTGTSCTITQTKGSSSTNVSSSYVAEPRWYSGNKVSFAALSGYTISRVTIVCSNSTYATALKNSTYSTGAKASVSDTTVNIETSGDFTITLGAQSRISSITVEYTN